MSHLAEQHPRTRERHHCLLCERSFPTAERYKMHLSGRTHRHLELTQRRTIHTLFSFFTGHNCPVLTPLSESELAGLKWFPVEPGTIHFYHQATPLQRAMQVIHFIICSGVKIYVFWNIVSFSVICLPVSTAEHPRSLESSSSLLWEPQMLHCSGMVTVLFRVTLQCRHAPTYSVSSYVVSDLRIPPSPSQKKILR